MLSSNKDFKEVDKLREIAERLDFIASRQFFTFEHDWMVYIFNKTILNVPFDKTDTAWLCKNYPCSFLILVIDYYTSIEREDRLFFNYSFLLNVFKEWKHRHGLFRRCKKASRLERIKLRRLYIKLNWYLQ